MIKSIVYALNNSAIKSLSKKVLLTTKQSFSSSQNYQSLKSSDFAKELGLQQEFKQTIKLSKKDESSKFQMSATIFFFTFLAGGAFFIVSLIDSNELKLLKYRMKKSLGRSDNKEKTSNNSQNDGHEQNLRAIFDKNFKGRSAVDTKFLGYIQDYVDEILNKSIAGETKLNGDVLYIIEQLASKFIQMPQEKIIKNRDQLLQIFQKIVYHQLRNPGSDNERRLFLKEPELKLCLLLSKFLLFKGGLNQQLLGLKYLQSLKESHIESRNSSKLPSALDQLTQSEIQRVRQMTKVNRQIYEKSLRLSSSQSPTYEGQQKPDTEARIIKVKEQLMYSIQELKRVNSIQRAKLQFLQAVFSKLQSQQSQSKNSKKK